MIYSVSFSPDDVEFPSYEIATVAQPADVAQAIYSDIHTKRRAFYISPGAYVVAEIDDEDNDYIVEFIRGDEFMARYNVPVPHVHAGMYVRTPSGLPGKASNKYPTCEIVAVRVESRKTKWFALTELTSRGQRSKDVNRRHLIGYGVTISPFRVWRPVQVAPGLPTKWVLESVNR